jgi:hypothetical protein
MAGSGSRRENDQRPQRLLRLARLHGWASAAAVTLVATALVITEITDAGIRHWWAAHALTTDTVAGLLVLLITLLVANQVVILRQARDRSRAVAAQAAILLGQAGRSSRAVSAALDGSGDRDAASNELRTYMIMLLVGAPVLIDARASRMFLEQAQHFAAELARSLGVTKAAAPSAHPAARLDDALRRLRSASAPLLQRLSPDERTAATGDPSQ